MSYFGAATDVNPFQYPPIAYAEAQATANTTTSSSTYSLLNAMTITPLVGVYQVIFSCSASNSGGFLGAGYNETFFAIYVGGVKVNHSERQFSAEASHNHNVSINCQVAVDGSQAIEVRWNRDGGTSTCHERTLTVIKMADV